MEQKQINHAYCKQLQSGTIKNFKEGYEIEISIVPRI